MSSTTGAEKGAAAQVIQNAQRRKQAREEVEAKIAQRKQDLETKKQQALEAEKQKMKEEEIQKKVTAVQQIQSAARTKQAIQKTDKKVEEKRKATEKVEREKREQERKHKAAQVLQCAQRQRIARREIHQRKQTKKDAREKLENDFKAIYQCRIEVDGNGIVRFFTNPDQNSTEEMTSSSPECYYIAPHLQRDSQGNLQKKKPKISSPTKSNNGENGEQEENIHNKNSPPPIASTTENKENSQKQTNNNDDDDMMVEFLPTTSEDPAKQEILNGLTSYFRRREAQKLGEKLDLQRNEASSKKAKDYFVEDASPQLRHCQLLLHQLQETIRDLDNKAKTRASGELTSQEMQNALLIETGASCLVRKEAISSRPTMLQVLYCEANAEIDVVRQNNDSTKRIMVERLPLSLPSVTEATDTKEKAMFSAEEKYKSHFETCKKNGFFDFLQQGGMIPEEGSAASEEGKEKEVANHTSATRRETRAEEEGSEIDETDDVDNRDTPQQHQQHVSIVAKRRHLSKLTSLLLAKEHAQQEFALWRENKAILQFALEVLHSSEAHTLPISQDVGRVQPLTLLKTVRVNLVRLEEKFNLNRKNSNITGGKRSVGKSVEAQEEVSAERLRLYRELELLRSSENVLEACLHEKKHFLALLHRDRCQFVENIVDHRDLLKKKDEEISAGIATNTAMRRQMQIIEEKCKTLQRELEQEKLHSEELNRNLAAVKEKRRVGGGGSYVAVSPTPSRAAHPTLLSPIQHRAPPGSEMMISPQDGALHSGSPTPNRQGRPFVDRTAPITPYDITVDPKKHPKLLAEEQSKLLSRLYERELNKILHPPEYRNKLQTPVEKIELSDFTQRMYYKRREMHDQVQEKLRRKYESEGPRATSPKVSKEKVAQIIEKFGVTRVKEQAEKKEKAFNQLVVGKEKHYPKVSDEQRQETCERLFAMAEAKSPPTRQ